MPRRWKILLYSLFTAACLLAGAVVTFPWAALGRRLESEAARQIPGAVLVVNEIGPALPLGVRMASIVYQGPEAPDGTPGNKLSIDRIRLFPSLFRLLTGKLGASFDVQAFGGGASGSVATGRNENRLELKIAALNLADPAVEKLTGAQLSGNLTGAADLVLDPRWIATGGLLRAQIDNARVKSGKVKNFPLPALELGSPELEIKVEKGEGKIEKLSAKSPDLTLEVTGTVSMRPQLGNSLVRGQLKVAPSEAWLGRNASVKSLLSLAGSCRKPNSALEVPLDGPLSNPLPPTACR